ncbi:DUF3375 family protein [Thioclava sp. JE_KL1]|uniref:DUF3375 family protein n=1 Tax=Thioclava sp. JE_KL1 TaxID=2651187 RepID=UPI00128C8D48|nr:DUF3375 family protein [Thioclava sp. JE_KL1]MPQ96177.1 DUF3375 family protein [Thioclava sp. JE_KL1]
MANDQNLLETVEANPVLALLRQAYRGYALEVAYRVFRDEYALNAPIDRFLRICEGVLEEVREKQIAGSFKLSPAEQLEAWCSQEGGVPWFAIQDDPSLGRQVVMRPAARAALQIALEVEDNLETVSTVSLGRFLDDIVDAASHLRQDKAALVEKYKAQQEDIQRKIDALEAEGVRPVQDSDRQIYASTLVRTVRDMFNALGRLPTELRENLTEATDLFYATEESHGQVMRAVLEHLNEGRSRSAYLAMRQLADLHLDESKRRHLEQAVETILLQCSNYIGTSASLQARNFFDHFTTLSLQTVSEDQQAAHRVTSFIQDSTFERRLGQSRRLLQISETMRELAKEGKVSTRPGWGPVEGLKIDIEREAKNYWFDFRLNPLPPNNPEEVEDLPPLEGLDPEIAAKAVREAAEKEAHIDPQRLKRRVAKLIEIGGDVSLSTILKNLPPRYGLDEIAGWMRIAMSMHPSIFYPGWEFEMLLDDPARPGTIQRLRAADPVFTRTGDPGQGLFDGSNTDVLTIETCRNPNERLDLVNKIKTLRPEKAPGGVLRARNIYQDETFQ